MGTDRGRTIDGKKYSPQQIPHDESEQMPRAIWLRGLPRQLLQFPHTSMMPRYQQDVGCR